jgi:hypothetical protein
MDYRPIKMSLLPKELQEEKLKRDASYEIAVQNIYANKGLTDNEKQNQKAILWQEYSKWAETNIWEAVTDNDLLVEAETNLSQQVSIVNGLRTKLGQKTIEVIEKAIIKEA